MLTLGSTDYCCLHSAESACLQKGILGKMLVGIIVEVSGNVPFDVSIVLVAELPSFENRSSGCLIFRAIRYVFLSVVFFLLLAYSSSALLAPVLHTT